LLDERARLIEGGAALLFGLGRRPETDGRADVVRIEILDRAEDDLVEGF
jgi:hypothetical protein